jgi:Ala-tRNA(Pro) deacylase
MEQYQAVYNSLDKMNISFEIVEHPPVLTTEEADAYIVGKEGVRTKTLFLTNQKKNAYYLAIMDGAKRLDMVHLAEILNEKRISFASPQRLMKKMSLSPGSVSIFGLLNNEEHDIKVYLDKEMLSERLISFHPNDNTKTIFISIEDMYKFITTIGYEYTIVEL